MRLTHLLSKNTEPTLNKFIWSIFFSLLFSSVCFCFSKKSIRGDVSTPHRVEYWYWGFIYHEDTT